MKAAMKNSEYGELEVVNVRLVKEPSIISEAPVKSPEDAISLINQLLSQFDREVFCVLNVTGDGKPININIVSIGTINQAIVSPRDVFKSSILSNAAGFLAFHCHPTGNVIPSREDAVTTKRLKEAGEILQIHLIDHIIVGCGSGRSFSFMSEGLLTGDVISNFNNYTVSRALER